MTGDQVLTQHSLLFCSRIAALCTLASSAFSCSTWQSRRNTFVLPTLQPDTPTLDRISRHLQETRVKWHVVITLSTNGNLTYFSAEVLALSDVTNISYLVETYSMSSLHDMISLTFPQILEMVDDMDSLLS